MRDVPRSRYILFGAIAAIGCGVDLVSKAWLFSWPELGGGNVHWLWPGHAGFQLSWNQGALFGMGQGSTWLFAALSVLAGCAIPLWLFYWRAAREQVGDVVERGAAQPAAGGEERDRFQAVGLAGTVRPDQHDHIAARGELRRAIVAEVGERQAMDAGGGHGQFDI